MKKRFNIDLGERLTKVCRVLGIDKKDMAKAARIVPSYLTELCKGTRTNPGIAVVYKIAKHYQVSLDYLLLGEGDMFLPGKEAEEKEIDDFIPSFEGLADLIWLLNNSNIFKNLILSQASKVYFDNEEFIKMEIKRLRGIAGKSTQELEEK